MQIRPKSQKNSQNYGRKKFRELPFTLFALRMFMVDFRLQKRVLAPVTETSPMSDIYRQ